MHSIVQSISLYLHPCFLYFKVFYILILLNYLLLIMIYVLEYHIFLLIFILTDNDWYKESDAFLNSWYDSLINLYYLKLS